MVCSIVDLYRDWSWTGWRLGGLRSLWGTARSSMALRMTLRGAWLVSRPASCIGSQLGLVFWVLLWDKLFFSSLLLTRLLLTRTNYSAALKKKTTRMTSMLLAWHTWISSDHNSMIPRFMSALVVAWSDHLWKTRMTVGPITCSCTSAETEYYGTK